MLITKNFVVINNPKTGSSFVRKVLKKIYTQRAQNYSWFRRKSIAWDLTSPELVELFISPISSDKLPSNQHGAVSQIPEKYNYRAIVSVVRNPYTRLVSQYEFKWWQKNYHLFSDVSLVESTFPNFPNLSLDEFIDFKIIGRDYKYPKISKKKIGNQTTRFIEMFFNNPVEVIANISDDYILSGVYKKDLKPITFLQQENLTEDLISFLSQYDFTAEELEMIKNHKKVNVTKNKTANRMALHTPKSLAYINTYERLLFRMYEDLGIFYKRIE